MLRDARARDADAYVQAFADDPALAHNLGFEAPSLPAARKFLRNEPRDRALGEVARFAVLSQDEFSGMFLLHSFAWEHRRADCGLMIVPAARRRGLALEALRLLVGWAFGTLKLQRVGLTTLPGNEATQQLALRAGFRHEGTLHAFTREFGAPVDNVVMGMVPAWAA